MARAATGHAHHGRAAKAAAVVGPSREAAWDRHIDLPRHIKRTRSTCQKHRPLETPTAPVRRSGAAATSPGSRVALLRPWPHTRPQHRLTGTQPLDELVHPQPPELGVDDLGNERLRDVVAAEVVP